MAISKTTSESWFGRIGSSITGIIVGLLMTLAAIPLLFWNEGRAVHRAQTLAEGRGLVVEDVPTDRVNPANEKKLVHMTGVASSHETLADLKLGISVDNAIKLKRVVEMYQWHEHSESRSKKNLGGSKETTTTYTYSTQWSSAPINSSEFAGEVSSDRVNPPMPFLGKSFHAKEVDLGAFRLNEDQIHQCENFEPFNLSPGHENQLAELSQNKFVTLENNMLVVRKNEASNTTPSVGDLRVSFQFVGPSEISFIYQQKGKSFQAYKLSQGSLAEFAQGKKSADEIFSSAETANNILLWALRVVGFGLMAAGFGMIFRPITVMADVVPLLGSLVGAGFAVIAGLLAACISLVVISIAWIFYRPVLGVCLLLAATAIGFLIRKFMVNKSNVVGADQPVVLD